MTIKNNRVLYNMINFKIKDTIEAFKYINDDLKHV